MTLKDVLENPLGFATATALIAAIITYAYLKTITEDAETINKSTFKVAFVVFIVNVAVMYFIKSPSKEAIKTEPFMR